MEGIEAILSKHPAINANPKVASHRNRDFALRANTHHLNRSSTLRYDIDSPGEANPRPRDVVILK